MSRPTVAIRAGPVALALAWSAMAGCGDDGSRPLGERFPEGLAPAPIRSTVESYFDAVDRADGEAICSRLSRRLERRIATLQSAPCEKALAEEARRLPESLNAYEVRRVEVARDVATVLLQGAGGRDQMRLAKLGREWKIADAPGLGG